MPAVLICHPSEEKGRSLERLLAPDGYEMRVVQDTGAAVEEALSRKSGFDAAIVGLTGKENHGLEVVGLLRKINSKLPVVVVNEEHSLEAERKVREQRVFYYLLSPVEPEELREVVKEAVGHGSRKR